jgi:hypothetical protein
MGNKDRQEYKVPVTKEKLLEYMKVLEAIKIMPVKNEEEPILILKTLRPAYGLLGVPDEVVIHNGHFILSRGIKRIKVDSKTVSCLAPAKVAYPDKFKINHPPKEFLIKSILDNEIPISDTRYIRPIRDFFREYDILEERRGKNKGIDENVKIRNRIIIEEYESSKRKIPLPIKKIQDRLKEEIGARGESTTKFNISDAEVRRIIKKHIKK